MLATCEHASGMGGMYVYDAYLQGMWAGAAICPLVVEEKKKKKKKKKTTEKQTKKTLKKTRIQRSERYI